jgi:hypothetical protein
MKRKSVSEHWDEIFKKYNILDHINKFGSFTITAKQIKEHKEPRLMTKFDHQRSRPKIFKQNKLGILPIDNGVYKIGRFNLYETIPKDDFKEPIEINLPAFFESIDPDNIYSESNALNVALISGMISDVIGEDLYETISGRMRTDQFDFNVEDYNNKTSSIHVEKPQIEVDGGYESQNKLVLIEAKNTDPVDFIVRQLYYPYRFWRMKVEKEIVPIFFTYNNGQYSFYIYKFNDDNNYNSLELVNKVSYRLIYQNPRRIRLNDIHTTIEDHSIPFPQADSFTKIKGIFDFERRQGYYYLAAARYLGLITKSKNMYSLSNIGKKINKFSQLERNANLAKLILSHGPFKEVYSYYMKNNKILSKNDIVYIMHKYNLNINKPDVYYRRAGTIKGWIQWIIYSGVEVI